MASSKAVPLQVARPGADVPESGAKRPVYESRWGARVRQSITLGRGTSARLTATLARRLLYGAHRVPR